MMYRLLSIFKHGVFSFFKFILYILRCGKRKRAPVDDSLPTDVVIGDAINANSSYPAYAQSSALTNGYEMPSPTHYGNESSRHPYQSQLAADQSPEIGNEADDMQSWGEWDYSNCTHSSEQQSHIVAQEPQESPKDEEVDFFADMEPTVKVKKIYLKKKQTSTSSDASDKFSINKDLEFRTSAELEDWVDDDGDADAAGWDDDDIDIDIDAAKVAKEGRQMRKQERLQRSDQQKRSKCSNESGHRTKSHKLGTKVS